MVSFTFLVAGYKGLHILQWFCQHYDASSIKLVIAEPDETIKNDYYLDIKSFCENQNISFAGKDNFLAPGAGEYTFVIGWRWLLPVNDQTIIFHDALLPRYRGFAPLVNALINGEKEIGATALKTAPEYDRGDIIFQESCPVVYPIKIEAAIQLMARLYCNLLGKIMTRLQDNKSLPSMKQNEKEASYSLWRDEEDYRIDWNKSSSNIKRSIDALGYPYKAAFTFERNRKICVEEAEEVEDVVIENRVPGKVIFLRDSFPVVVCGAGLLKIISAFDELTGQSLLPLKKIRTRFK